LHSAETPEMGFRLFYSQISNLKYNTCTRNLWERLVNPPTLKTKVRRENSSIILMMNLNSLVSLYQLQLYQS